VKRQPNFCSFCSSKTRNRVLVASFLWRID
jgi:hypothetical protein